MGYKDKLSEGIDARGILTFDQVSDAVKNVTEAMGANSIKITSIDMNDQTISLEVFDTGLRKIGGRSLLGAIVGAIAKEPDLLAFVTREQGDDGGSIVSVNVSDAATTSSSVMFIPAGTTVHGITPYRNFLTHLTAQLRRADPTVDITRRGKE